MVYEDEESADAALRELANKELDTRKLYLRKVGWCDCCCRQGEGVLCEWVEEEEEEGGRGEEEERAGTR